MTIAVASLYRYPVKGLSPEALSSVRLWKGQAVPGDRRYALAREGVQIDPGAPRWLPKRNFLMLALNARLAALTTRYDEATDELTIERDGRVIAHGRLSDAMGRTVIESFFSAYLGAEAGGRAHVVAGPQGHTFSDVDERLVSLINLASVRDMARAAGRQVEPLRFRANIHIEGAPPWAEFGWVGKSIVIGDARLRVTARITRCAATSVNPETGERDLNVVRTLNAGYGHIDMGIYATVIDGGEVTVGDPVALADT